MAKSTKPDEPKITRRKPQDYKQDSKNANKGSLRGERMIGDSYSKFGPVTPWVADEDDTLISGNQSQKAGIAAGTIEEVWEIEAPDGVQVVVKKPGLRLDGEDTRAREMAVALNQSSETSYTPDIDELLDLQADGADLSQWIRDDEIEALLGERDLALDVELALESDIDEPSNRRPMGDEKAQVKPVLYVEQVGRFEQAVKLAARQLGTRNRGDALMHIIDTFLKQAEGEFDNLLEDVQ